MNNRTVLTVAALLTMGCTSEATRLDEQVRELCRKDGGLYVYEKVELPADRCPEDADIKHLEQGVFKPASTSK
jgi:hypothetical protein